MHCKCFDHKNYSDWKLQGPCRDICSAGKMRNGTNRDQETWNSEQGTVDWEQRIANTEQQTADKEQF